jgi:hypothetical protein
MPNKTAPKTALITGASFGIGEEFARQLAAQGYGLVLVARREDLMHTLADQLRQQYGVPVWVIGMDLSSGGAVGEALQALLSAQSVPAIDLLVNNAGFGTVGAFINQSPERERQMTHLNCTAVLDLCHAFLPGMVQRGQGGVINVASSASFQPLPYFATYAASKAYVRSLTEALQAEYPKLSFVCLCPGPVKTGFFEATGAGDKIQALIPMKMVMTSAVVVQQALQAYAGKGGVVVPGLTNQVGRWASWLTTPVARLQTKISAQLMRGKT